MDIIDPIIRQTDAEFWKLAHNFAIGDRVRVKETGHRGKITNIDQFSRHHVLLDSHHSVHCSASELEPEDFAAGENAATGEDWNSKFLRACAVGPGAMADPIIRDHVMQKYESADAGDALAKSGRFKIGDVVKDKWGHTGKITKITASHADISYENGIQGTVLVGYFKAA